MAHIDGTDANFESEVINAKGKVLVDFWATWCGPCQMLAPVLDEIGTELGDKIKIIQIDQVKARKFRLKLFFQKFRVIGADAEGPDCAHIPQHRIFYFVFQLRNILVRHYQVQFIFSGLR